LFLLQAISQNGLHQLQEWFCFFSLPASPPLHEGERYRVQHRFMKESVIETSTAS